MLLGCENFLTATKTKQEIESAISYANASSYVIKVDYPANTGVIKSPAGGEVSKKVTDSFSLSFEAASDYEFLGWSIIDAATNVELEKDKYLVLESMKLSSTTCTFVKEPEPELQLCLYAKIAKRPRIIDETPKNDPAGSFRDARIVVMFDQAMDSSSIYYTADEIQKLKQTQGIGDSAFLEDSTTARVYGYEKDGVQVYKNIQIINYNSEKSLLKYYSAPVFQDPRTLVIATDLDNPPPAGSQVLVTLSRNFSYNKNGKPVTLKEDSTWTYYTNANRDTDAPIVSTCEIRTKKLSTDTLQELTDSVSNRPVLYQGNLYFNIEVSDSGSGPAGYFYLNLEKAGQDENPPTYTIKVPFKAVTSNTATYQGKNYAGAGGFVDYDGYVIPDVLDDGTAINDGNYKITTLVFEDRNGRSTTKEINTYFYKDTTPPDLLLPIVGRNTAETPTLKLSFKLNGDNTDIGYVSLQVKESTSAQAWGDTIKYLPSTSAEYPIVSTGTQGAKTCTIKNLEYGKTYDIKAVFVDKAGNSVERLFPGIMTRPSAFADDDIEVEVVHTPGQRDRAKITVKNTDANPVGNYSGLYVEIYDSGDVYFYPDPSNTNDGESERYCEDPNKTYVCYTPYLDFSAEYKINIYKQIGHANGDNSVNYVQKTFKTKPASIASTAAVVRYNATVNSIQVTGIKPAGVTGCKVWVKKTSDPETAYEEQTDATETTYTINALVPGTQYDVKLIPYYSVNSNEGEPCILSGWTRPAQPKNFTISFTQNSNNTGVTAHLEWEDPDNNNFDKFVVMYNDSSSRREISKTAHSYDFNNIAFCSHGCFYVFACQNQSGETNDSPAAGGWYYAPPKKAVITSCGFDNTMENIVIKWDLPGTAPYIDDDNTTTDSSIYLHYGTSELEVIAGTSSEKTLGYNRNVITEQHGLSHTTTITFTPKDTTIPVSGLSRGETYYFAINTVLPNNPYGGVDSLSDIEELFVPLPVDPPTSVTCLDDKWITDTTARVKWTNPSGDDWEKINIYANDTKVGTVNKSDSPNNQFIITGLTKNTEYTLSLKAEHNGSESVAATKVIKTNNPYADANFRIVSGLIRWESVSNTSIGGNSVKRVQLRYIEANDPYTSWYYLGEETDGTTSTSKATYSRTYWYGGDKPNISYKNLSDLQLRRGVKYIFKLDIYGIQSNKELLLTTNTLEYTP